MRISDKELNAWGRALASRGLKEAIVGLRHCNFDDPNYEELRVIEHYSRVIEYLYHLGKYRINSTRKIRRYRWKLKERDKLIRKLRSQNISDSYADLPSDFFTVSPKRRET